LEEGAALILNERPIRGFSVVPVSSSRYRATSHLITLVLEPIEKRPLRPSHPISMQLIQARAFL
jgi:hypothetical protein